MGQIELKKDDPEVEDLDEDFDPSEDDADFDDEDDEDDED